MYLRYASPASSFLVSLTFPSEILLCVKLRSGSNWQEQKKKLEKKREPLSFTYEVSSLWEKRQKEMFFSSLYFFYSLFPISFLNLKFQTK